MSYIRTPAHRALRAVLIHQWQPWQYSTGPKSEQGKKKVSRNADKGMALFRLQLKIVQQTLREQDKQLGDLMA